MFTTRKFHQLMLCALLTAGVYGQQTQNDVKKPRTAPDKATVFAAIAAVKSGDFAPVDVETIAAAHAVEAIPILEAQFARSHSATAPDWLLKAKLASALVKLGDKDDLYWEFLVKQATLAVESDAPDFMNFDPEAKTAAGPSPEFIAWAKAHNVPPNGPEGTAAEDAMYWFPARLTLLASTGDQRAIPLLRQALLSPNHMIEFAAAQGLAEVQGKGSIPFIIEACERAPAAAASLIAETLLYFDDSEAQSAADTYIPKDRVKILREARTQGKKTPWSY